MNWTWNQSLSNRADAAQRLADATFLIDLGDGHVGTGFFFTGEFALTADHNVRTSTQAVFDCEYREARIRCQWIPEWSSERADIAVLRLAEIPEGLAVRPLPARRLPSRVLFSERCRFWAARRVMVFGYPLRGRVQEAWRIDGIVDATLPLIESREDGVVVERLNIKGSRIQRLLGISGGPVLDLETMSAVAVEGAYDPEQGDVRGTELAQLIEAVPALKRHFPSLLDETTIPERGVAALAIRSSDSLPALVPVSVRCSPAPAPLMAMGNEDALATDVAIWVAQYIRRFSGHLRKAFERTASFPVLMVPDGQYETLDPIRAALSVAYLARILHDFLCFDLSLPVVFPESLMVCAAGIGHAGGEVTEIQGWCDAVQRESWPSPTTIWHAAERSGTRRLIQPLPPTVKLVSINHMDQIAQSLLGELDSLLPHSEVPATITNSMRQSIDELYTLETLLEVAAQEALGKQARIERLEEEIAIRERQLHWLDETALTVRERLRKCRAVPSPSELLDQFTALEQKQHGRTGGEKYPEILVIPSDFDEQSRRCLLLYRRLARVYHPDVQPAETEMFLQLVAHRWDLTWLEAVDGINQPLHVDTTTTDIEKRIDLLVDRLYSLKDTRERLDRRIARKEEELQSLGGRTTLVLDEELKSRQAVLSILKQDIDRGWRTLNYMAGWDRQDE